MSLITDKRINQYLESRGFHHANLGYGYLMDAIRIKNDSPYEIGTCIVYGLVAELYGETPTRIERAIRHSIETSDCPEVKNREFIAKAVDDMRYADEPD